MNRKIKNTLYEIKSLLNEDYMAGSEPSDERDGYMQDSEGQEAPEEGSEEIDFGDESVDGDDNKVINNIRSLALQGIQKYSDEVTNELYEFYKKIWAECDKLITDAAKKQEIGGNNGK